MRLLVIIILATGAVTWYMKSRELAYNGCSLTAWIKKGYFTVHRPMTYLRVDVWPEEAEANEAVRRIGTNAVPSLLTMLQAKSDSKLKLKVLTWLQSHHYANSDFLGMDANMKRICGSCGLSILGADAKAAVPALTRLLEHGDWHEQRNAALVLYNMGSIGIQPLREVLANVNSTGRPMAAYFLGHYADQVIPLSRDKIKSREEIDEDAEVIVPELMRHIGDQDQEVRMWAIVGLGRFGKKSEIVVPALIQVLVNTNQTSEIRECAIMALGNFGKNGTQAIPALQGAARENDSNIRTQAIFALKSINDKL